MRGKADTQVTMLTLITADQLAASDSSVSDRVMTCCSSGFST